MTSIAGIVPAFAPVRSAGKRARAGLLAGLALAAMVALPGLATEARAQGLGPAATREVQRPGAELFAVHDVAVDATSDNAAKARDIARAQGERDAFQRLIERLVLPEDRVRVPPVSDDELTNLIRNFEVQNERTSTVRYLGTYTFRFDPAGVGALLTRAGVPYIDKQAPGLLVLPVYNDGSRPILWEGANPWFDSWQATPPKSPLVTLSVPYGDLSDVTTISGQQAAEGDQQAIGQMLDRYHVQEAVVAELVAGSPDPVTATSALTLRLHRLSGFNDSGIDIVSVPPGVEGATAADRFALAEGVVVNAVADSWKRLAFSGGAHADTLDLTLPVGSLQDWISARKLLTGLPFVQGIDVTSLTVHEVQFRVRYTGGVPQLQQALAQNGYSITDDSGTPAAGGIAPVIGPLTPGLHLVRTGA
ncbi:DUF2066 domain-containing protein [Radicibacter daui]|uniref:DUF2066 domain-containing protein n=1 Tax=Radicibacter daui TaxID=3064829 RepID=UPI004046D97F